MPNIKSAKKRVLVTETKTLQNKMLKSELKTLIKKFDAAVESGDKAAATEAYKVAVKKIDKAVGKSIIAKNTSNRKKSKLTVKCNGNDSFHRAVFKQLSNFDISDYHGVVPSFNKISWLIISILPQCENDSLGA